MIYNIITVAFGALRKVTSLPINYKFDIGQILRITGLDLPESYVVDFCNAGDATTISMVGTADGVRIPDEFLQTGKPVKAYVVLSGADNTQTRYEITIPVNARPERTDIQPTPEEQSTIDSLIAAMNMAVEESGENADRAESEADRAEQAAESIGDKVERAEAAAQTAETAATNAEDAKDAANLFARNAAESAEAAHLSEVSAEDSASTATAKAAEASQSAAQAAASAASIEGDVAEAQQAAQTATQAASQATQSATAAQGSATAAESSATTASTKAAEASASATTASGKATEAANAATAAQTAQTGAETARQAAEAAQQAAEEAAEEAATILVDKAPVITDTASGAVASFPDGAENLPLKSLVAQIEPQQDLHGQDAPYPPGGGKNLGYLDESNNFSSQKSSAVYSNNGAVVTAEGTYARAGYHIPVISGTTYTVSFRAFGNGNYNYIYWKMTDSWNGGSTAVLLKSTETAYHFTFTADSDDYYFGIYVTSSGSTGSITVINFQLELGSTATAFAPYSNICTITGWTGAEIQRTGKNLLDDSIRTELSGRYVRFNTTGELTKKTITLPQGTYTFSYTLASTFSSLAHASVYDADTSGRIAVSYNSLKVTFTLSRQTNVFLQIQQSGLTSADVLTAKLELGSTATAYEPYQGDSLSVNWQDEAGTVYGSTIAIDEDGRCKLTVDKYLYVYDGTEPFSKSGTALNGFYNQLSLGTTNPHNWPRMINYGAGLQITDECSSMFKPTRDVNTYKQSYGYVFFDSGHNFDVPPETFGTTVASFKAKLAELYAAGTPVSVFCRIAEPIVYNLPDVTMLSSLLGTNNIWVDTGDTTVDYRADTKKYIQKIIASALA